MASGTIIQLDGLDVEVENDGVGRDAPWNDPSFRFRVRPTSDTSFREPLSPDTPSHA
jgi:hypothetical protein